MKKYEYKFVEIQRRNGLKVKTGETFEECKQVIMEEAEQGGIEICSFSNLWYFHDWKEYCTNRVCRNHIYH